MILEILRQTLTRIQTRLELGMGDITGDDDSSIEADTGTHRILGKFSTDGINALVQIYLDTLRPFARTAILFRNQFGRVGIHLLDPHAVGVDLALDIAVGRAAHAHTDRAAGTVARETDHADVVGQVFSAELGAEADLGRLLEEFLFEVDVAEGTAGLITDSRQVVVVFDAGELHGEKVLLRGSTAYYKCDMVWRAGRCSQALHLLDQERKKSSFVLDRRLGHRIEISLVGTAASLGDHHEAVFVTLGSLDIDLCRKVALGVDLIVHIQRSILAVTEILLCKGIEHTAAQSLFIFEAGPYPLTLLAMDNGSTGVLAERQHTLYCSFGVAEELQGNVFIVLGGLRVMEYLSDLLVVGAAQHELAIVE